jgi:hypothetical protein
MGMSSIQLETVTSTFKDLGMYCPSFFDDGFTIRDCYLISCGDFTEYFEKIDDIDILKAFIESYDEMRQNIIIDFNDLVDDTLIDTAKAFYIAASYYWCTNAIEVIKDLVEDGTIQGIEPDSNVVPLVRH